MKWTKQERNIKKDDVVLIVDNTPRNSWTMGRVIEVVSDTSGIVRIAKVKTPTTVLTKFFILILTISYFDFRDFDVCIFCIWTFWSLISKINHNLLDHNLGAGML